MSETEQTPVERAAEALATDQEHIPWAGHRHPDNWEGHALAALASIDVEGLAAGPLYDHWPLRANYECKCGVVTGDPAAFTTHQAEAVKAWLTGGGA
jgi:hypothetical protein